MATIPDYPSARELVEMLAAGQVTSEVLVEEAIRRANANASLNALITLDAEGALRQARDLDGAGIPLRGLPIVVKDNIHVAGLANTAGTPGLESFVPKSDNTVVAKLKREGAIVLAKANLHELAFGITSNNGRFGAVGNPFDPTTFAGGSSGGTAAAISAGIVSAGLGTDTGGSVRIPAALTGIVGFRPTTGRYDSTAVTPISRTRDTIGVMARTVGDVQLLDRLITEVASPIDPPQGIRLGIARDYYFAGMDTDTASVIDDALDKLVAAGIVLVEVDPDNLADLDARSGFPIAVYETVRDLTAYLEHYSTGQTFDSIVSGIASPDVAGLLAAVQTEEGRIPEAVYQEALQAREEMQSMFAAYFADNRLHGMIFPTTILPSRPIEGSVETVELNGETVPTFPTYIRNTDPGSIAGLPGISIPAGTTAAGLPVGIEIDGPAGSDTDLLAIARFAEEAIQFSARP